MVYRLVSALFAALSLCSAAHAEIRSVTAPEALQSLNEGRATLIDIRTPTEWALTGLPAGARAANMHDPDFVDQVIGAVSGDFDAAIILVCRTGRRSTQAAAELAENGFTNVSHIPEGVAGRPGSGPGWIARGLPLTSYSAD